MGPTLLLLTGLALAQVAEPVGPPAEGTAQGGAAETGVIGIGCFEDFVRSAPLPAPLRQVPVLGQEFDPLLPESEPTGSAELAQSLQRLAAAQCDNGLWGTEGSGLQPTAWALLALQGAGHTYQTGTLKAPIKAALKAFIERQRDSERGGFCPPEASLAERALTTRAVLMAYTSTNAYAMKRAASLAYGELLEAAADAPAAEADGWVWSTLALLRARGLQPRTPAGWAPRRFWDDAAIDGLLLRERLAAWEADWSGSDGEVWDAARLAEHLPWLLTARLVSTFTSVGQVDTRFLDAHPELASADFSDADVETLCWLAWVAGECDPPRFPGWRERLRSELGSRLATLARDGDERQTALATMALVSLQQP